MVSATQMIREHLKALGREPTTEEIKKIAKKVKEKLGRGSTSLVYKVLRKMPRPEVVVTPAPAEAVITVKEEEEAEVPVIEEAEAPAEEEGPKEFKEKAVPIEEIEAKLEAGVLTSEDLSYIWQSVNQLFPEKHQRPEKAMSLLGKLWVKPANRLVEKYATENVDLYLALGGTALVFAPSIIGMVREKREKEKKEVKK